MKSESYSLHCYHYRHHHKQVTSSSKLYDEILLYPNSQRITSHPTDPTQLINAFVENVAKRNNFLLIISVAAYPFSTSF